MRWRRRLLSCAGPPTIADADATHGGYARHAEDLESLQRAGREIAPGRGAARDEAVRRHRGRARRSRTAAGRHGDHVPRVAAGVRARLALRPETAIFDLVVGHRGDRG